MFSCLVHLEVERKHVDSSKKMRVLWVLHSKPNQTIGNLFGISADEPENSRNNCDFFLIYFVYLR